MLFSSKLHSASGCVAAEREICLRGLLAHVVDPHLQPRLQRNRRTAQLAEARDREQAFEQIVEPLDSIEYCAQRRALLFERLHECVLSFESHRRDRVANLMRDLRSHPAQGGGAVGARQFFRKRTRFVACCFKPGDKLIKRVYDSIEFALASQP